ncbi:short transient receptor potential channel 4-like isoform X2 [Ptychodera flava]|uniref:short transient receptor potential channel 4-like isoform X2 n=1 Tax=Ptychodera flava TaxID=63121 RepID=UPI00396AAE8A
MFRESVEVTRSSEIRTSSLKTGKLFDIQEKVIKTYQDHIVEKIPTSSAPRSEKLIRAVLDGDVQEVEKLLSKPESAKRSLHSTNTFRGIETTALQIAAENNDFRMVELLFDKVPPKNDEQTKEDSCYKQFACLHSGGDLAKRLCLLINNQEEPIDEKVSLLRAVSSPAYICVSYLSRSKEENQKNQKGKHFLQHAFEVFKELKQLVGVLDYTIWKETIGQLQDNLTKFTVDILNSCITIDEVAKLLKGENEKTHNQRICYHFLFDRENRDLLLAKEAIETKQKKFIVQEKCQHFLKQEWLRGQPGWAKKKGKLWSSIYLFYSIFVFGIICQLIPVQLFFCKGTRLQKFFHSPKTALLTHYYTYASFLLFFFIYDVSVDYKIIDNQIALVSNINYWPILILSLIWFGALLVHEFAEILEEGFRYFKSYWNFLDFLIFTFFIGSAILGNPLILGSIYQNPYVYIILSKLASLSFIFALLRLLKPLYLSHFLGPMLIIFTDMRHDIFRFLIIFGYVVLAFALAMYYFYVDLGSDQSGYAELSSSLTILITTIFGGDGTDDLQVDQNRRFNISPELSRYASTAADYYVSMGYVLYTFFGIIVIVMLLNLCIAMMSDRYTRIQEVIDLEWKFERTKIWISYICTKRAPMTPATTLCYLFMILFSPLIICLRRFISNGKQATRARRTRRVGPETSQVQTEEGTVNSPVEDEGTEENPDNFEVPDEQLQNVDQELAKLTYHMFLKLLLHRYYVKHVRRHDTFTSEESQDQKQERPQTGFTDKQLQNASDMDLASYDSES